MRLIEILCIALWSLQSLSAEKELEQSAAQLLEQIKDIRQKESAQNLFFHNKYQELIWHSTGKVDVIFVDNLFRALERYMVTAPIISQIKLSGGATKTKLVTFENGIKAVYKKAIRRLDILNPGYLSSSPSSEAAAYRLDRLLRFNLVPVTILRYKFQNKKYSWGSFQYFVEEAKSLDEVFPDNHATKPTKMIILDYILKNYDRHDKNYLYHKELEQFIAIDNSWSLRGDRCFFCKIATCLSFDKRSAKERKMLFSTIPQLNEYYALGKVEDRDIRRVLEEVGKKKIAHEVIRRKYKILRRIEEIFQQERSTLPLIFRQNNNCLQSAS